MHHKATFRPCAALHCLGLREPRCYPALSSRCPKACAEAARFTGGSPPSISFQADFHHDARRSFPYGQCDPRAGHGCCRKGQIRASRPADGRRRHRHRAVHAVPEIRRRRSALAGPRPFCSFGRAWLDAAIRAALPHRQCRHDAGADQEFSPARFQDAGPPGKFPHLRRRNHDRPARPGRRLLGRIGIGRAALGGGIRRGHRRSPYLCAVFRRRSDGRRQP